MKFIVKSKFIRIIVLIMLFINVMLNNDRAVSYSFNFTGPSTAYNGENVTLTVTGNGLTGNVTLYAENATLSSSSVWIEKNSATVTAKITGFPAKITATPQDLSDNEYNTVGKDEGIVAKTITINEKKPDPTPEPTQRPTEPTPTPEPTKIPSETTPIQRPEEPKSSNNYLKSLSINVGTLKPAFSRSINNYTVEFDENFDLKKLNSIKISGDKENEKASIEGLGEKNVKDGDNNFEIKVTAENGTVRTYTIKVVKPIPITQSDLRIKSLEINAIDMENKFIKATLNELFDPNVFDYTLDVKENIIALDIDPKIENEDITVTVEGSENLLPGENIVKIILASKDDENVKTVYTIKVIKDEGIEATSDDIDLEGKTEGALGKYKSIVIGIVSVIVILAIVLITLIVINHKGKKKLDKDKEKYGKDIGIKDLKDNKLFDDNSEKNEKKTKSDKKDNGKGKRFN